MSKSRGEKGEKAEHATLYWNFWSLNKRISHFLPKLYAQLSAHNGYLSAFSFLRSTDTVGIREK